MAVMIAALLALAAYVGGIGDAIERRWGPLASFIAGVLALAVLIASAVTLGVQWRHRCSAAGGHVVQRVCVSEDGRVIDQ